MNSFKCQAFVQNVYKRSSLRDHLHMNEAREYGERVAAALAEVIEEARWAARIRSANDLAARAGMTHTYLYKRLSGEVTINVRDLGSLAEVLGVGAAELVQRAVDRAEASDPAATLGAVANTGQIEGSGEFNT